MSDIIQLLPDSVANQIAAGEVIQRPASVIKELVENAVDAGATMIQVLVVDAGRTSIQVIDDGCGMSETDARLAFERHATSKIRKADDLFSLHTMGFRGEALPSIVAVSQVELRTRLRGEDLGTHLSLSGSRFVSQEPCSCPVGSNFLVENLFFNVPARRKFLKSNATELNNIVTAFQRIALVNPDISFSLLSNGAELFNLRASNLRQRVIDIFGKRLNQDLLSLNVETSIANITGFVGKPESARKKGAHQYFFVNGRYMKHAYFHKAVANAFERLVPTGEQVPYFIYFTVPASDIDVNIHPTKTEIKFENEQAIWQILHAAVKEAVGLFSEVTAIDFDVEGKPDIPVFNPNGEAQAPAVSYNPQYNPFKSAPAPERPKAIADWQQLYDNLVPRRPEQMQIFDEQPAAESPSESIITDKAPTHYQYKGQYIMTAVKSGLMVIDQHRAHVRILYEEYLERQHNRQWVSQKLLFPEIIQFTQAEQIIFSKVADQMLAMGFEFSDLGSGSFSISAVPADLDGLRPVELVHDMIDSAAEKSTLLREDIEKTLSLTMARNAAIPYGQVLSNEEMENVVNKLFSCTNVNYTPDGKSVLGILKQQDIDHLLA